MPSPVCAQRRKLLIQLLREWEHTGLKNHLSLARPAIITARIKSQESVKKCARDLLDALKASNRLYEHNKTANVAQMLPEGRQIFDLSRKELEKQIQRLNEEQAFLAKLATISPKDFWKPRRGQPPNFAAYLVLQDAAAIFEWFSGKRAARNVDRVDGSETGTFFRFVSVLWPVIFNGGTAGLQSAIRNWAVLRKRHEEQSALIYNINMRHPEWGLFNH